MGASDSKPGDCTSSIFEICSTREQASDHRKRTLTVMFLRPHNSPAPSPSPFCLLDSAVPGPFFFATGHLKITRACLPPNHHRLLPPHRELRGVLSRWTKGIHPRSTCSEATTLEAQGETLVSL